MGDEVATVTPGDGSLSAPHGSGITLRVTGYVTLRGGSRDPAEPHSPAPLTNNSFVHPPNAQRPCKKSVDSSCTEWKVYPRRVF